MVALVSFQDLLFETMNIACIESYDVFLSHNSSDKPAVEVIGQRLRDMGLRPFFDKWHLTPGTPWQTELEEALSKSTCTAVFLGASGKGAWHHQEMQVALNTAARTRDDYRVIPVLLPGADPHHMSGFLELRTWVDFRAGLDDEVAFCTLVAAVKGVAPQSDEGLMSLPDEPQPYQGLDHFEGNQYELFFGRDDEIRRLIKRLANERTVIVIGASGSGKSSLVRAGLCTNTAEATERGIRDWQRIIIVPGTDPLRATATQLVSHLPEFNRPSLVRTFLDNFRSSDEGLIEALSTLFPNPNSKILLVVDQLEEIFTLSPGSHELQPAWRERMTCFAANLMTAHQAHADWLRIAITLRADFLDFFVRENIFRDLLEQRQFWISEMGEVDMREAIVFPAKRRGAYFEKGLVELILRDMSGQTSALPLLEEALEAVWNGRRGPWLTLSAYEEAGGVGGALATKAKRVYGSLNEKEQATARHIFLKLIQLGEGTRDTRRRVPLLSLLPATADPERIRSVINRFSCKQVRLITHSRDDQTDTIEITHEALISHWDQLGKWLDTGRDDLRLLRRLDEAAQQWNEQERPDGSLWRPPNLVLLRKLVEATGESLTALQLEFYEYSCRAEEERITERKQQQNALRKRLRIAIMAAVVASSLLIVSTWLYLNMRTARHFAEDRRTEAEVASRREAAHSAAASITTARMEYERGRINEAVHRLNRLAKRDSELQWEALLLDGLIKNYDVRLPHDDNVKYVEFAPTGGHLLSLDRSGRVHIWETSEWKVVGKISEDGIEIEHATWLSSINSLLTIDSNGIATVWAIDDLKPTRKTKIGTDFMFCDASKDGKYLYVVREPWTVAVLSLPQFENVREFACPKDIRSFDISPSGNLYVATSGNNLFLGETKMGTIKWRTKASDMGASSLYFSPNELHVVITSYLRNPTIISVETGEVVAYLEGGHHGDADKAIYSQDGTLIVTLAAHRDFTARVWQSNDQKLLKTMSCPPTNSVSISAGNHFLAAATDYGEVRVWNLNEEQTLQNTIPISGGSRMHALHQDLARAFCTSTDGLGIDVFDLTLKDKVTTLRGNSEQIVFICGCAGNTIAALSEDGTIHVWHALTGDVVTVIEAGQTVQAIALAPNGTRIAIATPEGVSVVGIESHEELASFPSDGRYPQVLEFSPDNDILAVAEFESVSLYRISSGELATTLTHNPYIQDLTFSPNGQYLVSCTSGSVDRSIRMWDMSTAEYEVYDLGSHARGIQSVCFSADGKRLASGSVDGVVKIWDVDNRVNMISLNTPNSIRSLMFDSTLRLTWSSREGISWQDVFPAWMRFTEREAMLSTMESVWDGCQRLLTTHKDKKEVIIALKESDLQKFEQRAALNVLLVEFTR